MPSLDDLKKRIKSVKSTQKITKAMKMVAAAKLKKAQASAEKGRPFSEKMNNIILNLSNSISDKDNASKFLVGTGKDSTHLCVVITADRGLCGGFNTNICRKARNYFDKILKENKTLKIFTVGSKGYDQLKRIYGKYIVEKVNFKGFKKITYKSSMLKYGTDKPDLRNPIEIFDVTEIMKRDDVKLDIFKKLIEKGGVVRAIPAPNTSSKPRSFFDGYNNWAKEEGAKGLGYIILEKNNGNLIGKGPIGKFFSEKAISELVKICKLKEKDAVFFSSDKVKEAEKISGIARQKLGKELNLINNKKFEFCWITDYPMYQYDEKEKKIDFSHNPFSMPQINIKDFDKADPLSILAYQYDLVCNGYEISSGAIRNHLPDLMYKVFSKVGYSKTEVNSKFEGMIKALSYGAPPHGGMAPGIDRIVMLLAEKDNIREVTLFPMNQNAQDLLMGAPSKATDKQLKDLGIKVLDKKK